MSSTKTKSVYEAATEKADSILKAMAPTWVSITKGIQDLAVIVVDVRAESPRDVTSKRTKKAVTVPDWDGRGAKYREWYNDILIPMLNQRIPVEFLGTVRTRLQNQVQEEMHRRATPAEKAHLGLKKQSKSKTQAEKKAQSTGATTTRTSDEAFTTDALVAHVKTTPLHDSAQSLAAQCEAVLGRIKTKKELESLTPAQRKKADTLLAQSIQYLMSARSILAPAVKPAKTEKTAA